nr:site-specific integrase [Acidobacteriota bacterium]
RKRQRFALHLVPVLGSLPLTKITSFNVDCYKKHRLDEKASPGTVNRELAALSHLFNKAEEWGWIRHRPAKIRRLKENAGRVVYLTVEQAGRLVEAAKKSASPQVYPFIFIALETSMRFMEILSMRREHVDCDRKVIRIPKAKAGAREQPITARLAEYLRDYMASVSEKSAWLFPSTRSKSGHTMDIRESFRHTVQAAGLHSNEIVPHTLRHTAITHLVQAGVDLPTVQRISGHKTLIMVTRYAHQNGEHVRAAMDKLEERYRQTG